VIVSSRQFRKLFGKPSFVAACTLLAAGLLGTRQAEATVMFGGSGSGLSASASFTISPANTLTILLSNTDAKADNLAPNQVLTGVFFNLGNAALSKVSATLPGGSSVIQTAQCNIACAGATNVSGEWGYAFAGSGFNPAVAGTNQGIASAGYLGGANKRFDKTAPNYDGPASGALNGSDFGVVPDGWTGTGNGGVENEALIEGPVKFVLNIPVGLTEAMISNVYFTYGTAYGERTLTGSGTGAAAIPEPGSLALMGAGFAFLASQLRRRRRS
jgi:hypothetical protein